jgi:hypothetical protein
MTMFFLSLGWMFLAILYILAAFGTGHIIQGWIFDNGWWGPVAIPWLWTSFWLIAVPAATISLTLEGAPK